MATLEESQAILRQLSPTQEKVDRAIAAAVEVAHPSRVFLFGSWPRGEARWDSDLDLAILMPDSEASEIGKVRKALRRKLDEIPMSIDLIVATEGHVVEFLDSVNSVYYKIVHRGKLVYDRQSR